MALQYRVREVHISNRNQLEELLNAAERELRQAAIFGGTHGILVTRRRPDLYELELSDHVPFGLTYERESGHKG